MAHRSILEAARVASWASAVAVALMLAPSQAGAAADVGRCPAAQPRVFVERFISASCATCWQMAPPMPTGGTARAADAAFVLDWIVADPARADAPLAAAAVAEATERARLVGGSLLADETLTRTEPLTAPTSLSVEATDGPALNGYIGLRLSVRYTSARPLPDVRGYLALVERLPAGSEGSPVERRVVRAVVGPLPLDGLGAGRPASHLRAVRVPDTGKAERLMAVAWLETTRGRVLAADAERDASCPAGP